MFNSGGGFYSWWGLRYFFFEYEAMLTGKRGLQRDGIMTSWRLFTTSEVLINEAAGEIYCIGRTISPYGTKRPISFYRVTLDNNFLNQTQNEIFSILSDSNSNYDFAYSSQSRLSANLSEEVYAEFSNYLLSQSYDFNGESVSFSKGAEILDISRFNNGDAFGGQYIQFLVIDGSKIYTARLENAMPPSSGDLAIGQIMGYSNNVFKITEIKDFKEFDYEEEAAQAHGA